MITAGGTREPIDAVRFVGNRSSGKMGFALARAAFDRGAAVDLIEANVYHARRAGRPADQDAHRRRRCTTAVMSRLPDVDILIMAAAVADYKVVDGPAGGKMAQEPGRPEHPPGADRRHPVRRGRARAMGSSSWVSRPSTGPKGSSGRGASSSARTST